MKNTTVIMATMIQKDKKYSTKEIQKSTSLTPKQIKRAMHFLKRGGIIKVKHTGVDKPPYRKAWYYLNEKKYDIIISLLKREGLDVT